MFSNHKSQIANRKLFILPALSLVLAGCGVPGIPRPPSLELPQPPGDLHAARKGEKVTLTWTQPKETTDKEPVRHLGETRICRDVNTEFNAPAMKRCASIATVPAKPAPRGMAAQPIQMSYADTLSPELENSNPAGAAQYAVEVLNTRGRTAGMSNQASVPLAPTPPPPSDLAASVEADGIHLTATPPTLPEDSRLRFSYRVYRTQVPLPPKQGPAMIAEIPAGEKINPVDLSFAWEQHYEYRMATATTLLSSSGSPAATVEGDDSAPIEVFARDVFPPAAPSGLEAVFSGLQEQKFIDLTWNANTESDLAGYNLYRHEENGEPQKINAELAKTPAFRDANVQPGHTYFYSVSAVDLRNNESARSTETSETVPAQ